MDFRFVSLVVVALSTVTLLTACPGTEAEEGEESGEENTSETGSDTDEAACVDPGTPLLDGAKPVGEASKTGNPQFTCASGWGWDAEQRDAAWTVQVPDVDTMGDPFQPGPLLSAHPEGGVIVYGWGQLAHFDEQGEEVWAQELGAYQTATYVAVEAGGTFLVGITNYETDTSTLTRHDADGSELGTVDIPWNSLDYPQIWAMEVAGSDIVLGVFDTDSMGNYEETLLRLDADGNELLRKSTNLFGGTGLAVNDTTAMFGQSPGFIVALEDGEVLGQAQASQGFAFATVGSGDRYYSALNAGADFGIVAFSNSGGEPWLQAYDRAGLGDFARVIDANDELVVAAGTTQALNLVNSYWFSNQPMIMATDTEGDALWTDRIDAFGEASAVAIGVDGGVYVAGLAEQDGPPNEELPMIRWLRKY